LNFVLVSNHQQTAWWCTNQLRGDINMIFFFLNELPALLADVNIHTP